MTRMIDSTNWIKFWNQPEILEMRNSICQMENTVANINQQAWRTRINNVWDRKQNTGIILGWQKQEQTEKLKAAELYLSKQDV